MSSPPSFVSLLRRTPKIAVVGDACIGKTRLCRALRRCCAKRSVLRFAHAKQEKHRYHRALVEAKNWYREEMKKEKMLKKAEYKATIGVEVNPCPLYVDNVAFVFNIWDMGGDEKYGYLLMNYLIGSDAVIIVHEANKKNSACDWYKFVAKNVPTAEIFAIDSDGKLETVLEEFARGKISLAKAQLNEVDNKQK